MRNTRRWVPLLLCVLAALTAWAATQMMSVQVREGQLRERPSFLGKVVKDVEYGDRMSVVSTQGGWTKVKTDNGKTGWIHTSALTEKKVVMKAGDIDAETAASGEELALAGKGFNDEVEAEFKSSNPDVDYTWVDRMERMVVSIDESIDFLEDGDVQPAGGER
jgi:uncharacterized protein YgiM (DUF1202 family)